MISLSCEELLPVGDVPKRFPRGRRGRRIHVGTVYRWISCGAGGARLEAIRAGGVLYTSAEALQRFANRCSGATVVAPTTTSPGWQKRVDRANAELRAAGI